VLRSLVRRAGVCHGPWPHLTTVERVNRLIWRQSWVGWLTVPAEPERAFC
jgi:hypothetical protein